MYLCRFTMSDDREEFEGYTDGSLWNGWANICLTKEQAIKFLQSTPYDFRFEEKEDGAHLLWIYWENEVDHFYSSPLPVDGHGIEEGWFLDGLEFMISDEETN